MIRPILSYLAAPLLGRLGVAVVHAAREALDDADAAALNEARAIGERDEARRHAAESIRIAVDLGHDGSVHAARVFVLEGEIATLRSELDSAAVDDEAHAFAAQALADVRRVLRPKPGQSLANAAWTLTRDLADVYRIGWAAIVERDALALHLADVTEQRDHALSEVARVQGVALDALADVAPVEAKPAECTWCLVDVDDDWHRESNYVAVSEADRYSKPLDVTKCLPLCGQCSIATGFDGPEIRDRVALRARCCPTRRTSADPLAVACTLGCGADVGKECHPGRK